MFSLINACGSDIEYVEELIKAVRKEQREAQSAIQYETKSVSVKLVHEYQVTKKPRSVANIRYNTEERLSNGKVSCDSYLIKLEEGETYSMDPINCLIEGILEAVNNDIDMAAMCGSVLEAEDISDRVQRYMTSALEGAYIFDGVTVSTVVVANQPSEIIVTVC